MWQWCEQWLASAWFGLSGLTGAPRSLSEPRSTVASWIIQHYIIFPFLQCWRIWGHKIFFSRIPLSNSLLSILYGRFKRFNNPHSSRLTIISRINYLKIKLGVKDDPGVSFNSSSQDLKGKILLKAKKIGGLEESFNGMVEDSLTGEVSDEDEVAEFDEDNLHRESIRRRVKVGQVVWGTVIRLFSLRARQPIFYSLMSEPDIESGSSVSLISRLMMQHWGKSGSGFQCVIGALNKLNRLSQNKGTPFD